MPYYHTCVICKENEERRGFFHYGAPEAFVRERFAVPYMKNKPFLIGGRFVNPSAVIEINIFRSEEQLAKNIILPNGKSAMDTKDLEYVLDCFRKAIVKGVSPCVWEFITSPPEGLEKPFETPTKPISKKEKVFIVHGRDETQALRLQKYLTKTLKIDAEMFEDFKERSGSNTIIEQLEYIKDNVGYAFVIVTPDDLGCLRENIDKCRTTMLVGRRNVTVKSVCDILDNLHTRARQNVVFEHGLFIGALGRDRVCCLLQEDTKEKPSDIDGILYVGFKKSVKETFAEIAEKLKKVGLVTT